MLKIFGLFLMFISTAALGFISYSKFKLKVNLLEQFSYLVKHVEMKIQYTEELLFSIFASFKTENKILGPILSDFTENLKNNNFSNNNFLDCPAIGKVKVLENDEVCIINNFIRNLGTSDIPSQIKLCKITENSLKEKIKLALNEKEKKSKIYLLLHLAVGMVLIIIFL